LDEDDLELVEEFTGQRIERPSKSRLKRLRRAGDRDDEDDDESPVARRIMARDGRDGEPVLGSDLRDLWDDEGTLRAPRRDEEPDEEEMVEDDDMRGFIEADEDEEENEMGEAERQERLERLRAEKAKRRNAGGISKLAGLDQK
jgi:Acidic N-terminal SPT6